MFELKLNDGWQMTSELLSTNASCAAMVNGKKEPWYNCALPCDVHMPLIEAGIIPEPLEGKNCLQLDWIADRSWWFKKCFGLSAEELGQDIIELTMESLDSMADIFINGVHIGFHESSFYPFAQNIKRFLREGENTLLVRLTTGLEHVSENDIADVANSVPQTKDDTGVPRWDRRRIGIRKAQYAYGWDWGPRINTCGIVKDVWLRGYSHFAIRDVQVQTLEASPSLATLSAMVTVENLTVYGSYDASVSLAVSYDNKPIISLDKVLHLRSGLNYVKFSFDIKDPLLWWPNGMGTQNLYSVSAAVEAKGVRGQAMPFKIGIRTIEIDETELVPGERLFALKVNGERVFCKGGNWIPADAIYARSSSEKYKKLITEAADANFNMLRIWGGGIYETDTFYETCDRLGILVWQDFMFACAMYPDHKPDFCRLVETELDYQTRRLRNHPSIALFCGNNENAWAFQDWWPNRPEHITGGSIVYNVIAPRIVEQNCPNIPYWPSSPYGGCDPNSNEYGDRHHWSDCMMNPEMEKRISPEEYDKVNSKFVSEYGYIGPCARSSIEKYYGSGAIDTSSDIWLMHNNTFEKETVRAGIAKHYKDSSEMPLDEYLLYAGLCQGLIYQYSLEAIRVKTFCYGALFWMYNDCWGETGWTIIDYYTKRKISYYFVKRAFKPVKIILREEGGIVNATCINERDEPVSLNVEYGHVRFDGANRNAKQALITLPARSRGVALSFPLPGHDIHDSICYVKPAEDIADAALLRQSVFRGLNVAAPVIETLIEKRGKGILEILVKSNTYCHAVHFPGLEDLDFSDLYFDLLPGEHKRISVLNPPEGISEVRAASIYNTQ